MTQYPAPCNDSAGEEMLNLAAHKTAEDVKSWL